MKFVTSYGKELGDQKYFLVKLDYPQLFDFEVLTITDEAARMFLLEGTPYLHPSLMTDAERKLVAERWKYPHG